MFKMEDMIADMLKKAIPPEVMAMLTPEKLREIGDKANAFVADIRGSLDFIKAQNETTHELQTAILAKLEAMENVNGSDSNGDEPRQRRNKRTSASGPASGSGDGSATG